ncbi:MAG: fatty acid desaturase [Pirellulaceae bacterium]|nr:fatty acid desaturase [Pirellulaceae bacterium]
MSNPVPAPVIPFIPNRIYAITIAVVHVLGVVLLALLAFGPSAWRPYLFSWPAFFAFLCCIHLFGQGITIGYHRLLTHRSFKTPKWLEHAIAIIGICCMEDTPARWVTVHRMHHVHSDEVPDPHSPRVNFLWSHMGWLMFINRETYSIASLQKFSKDLLRDPFYMRLETNAYRQFYYILGQLPVFFLFGVMISYFFSSQFSDAVQMGSSMVVWAVVMRVIAVWHITWSVNSLSHMFGYQNYQTGEDSRNNWLVALLSVGEGWHNNHHEDPSAASVQHRWWELDLSYYEIKLLEFLGLASDIIPTRLQRRKQSAAAASSGQDVAAPADNTDGVPRSFSDSNRSW